MLTITSPYVQIADLNGDPLDDGSIYIGTAGLNAETNPITVYWDAAGTQPAAQPIKTRSGVVARNGSPARVYVNAGAYSITVRDKIGRLLASELSISSSVDASGITDGTIAEVKLDAALAAKINGAMQKSGGTMTGDIILVGNTAQALGAVPKQQAESIAAAAAADALTTARASTANVTAEQNADTFISPDRLKFAKAAVKAWVNFDGTGATGAITPRSSYNVTSVTKNASGDFTVAPSTQADALGAFLVSVGSGGTGAFYTINAAAAVPTTTTRRFQIGDVNGVASNPGYIFCALVGA